LFVDLNNLREELITELNNYRDYLLIKKEENKTNNWSEVQNYENGVFFLPDKTIEFKHSIDFKSYDTNLVWTWITHYHKYYKWNKDVYNIEDFSSDDSKDIVKELNNYTKIKWEKLDSREDYWLALANNIERDSKLEKILVWKSKLRDKLFLNSVNVVSLLKWEIKNEFLNINDNHTVKDIGIQEFNNDFMEKNSSIFLLRNELNNYGKLMMNNKFISQKAILPSTSKVSDGFIYKNYLKWKKWVYFNNYDKKLHKQIPIRNNVEWLQNIKFWYFPSPEQIKDIDNKLIGIKLWNISKYYLNDSNKWIEINLDNGYNYDVKIRSYNWTTNNLNLNLINGVNSVLPILLKWETISESNWSILSKIVDVQDEDDSIYSLYVNDILVK